MKYSIKKIRSGYKMFIDTMNNFDVSRESIESLVPKLNSNDSFLDIVYKLSPAFIKDN